MRNLNINPVKSFIVISDVHLRDPKDATTKLFLKTLDDILMKNKNEEKDKTEALFLLGDIFDFIAASKNFFLEMWSEVFEKFKLLKDNGIQVYFVEGNHDFGFEHFRSQKLDSYFTDYGDITIEFLHRRAGKMMLRHGDDLICPEKYLKFRSIVKGKFFQKLTSFLIAGLFMHFLFSRYAKISRAQDSYRKLQLSFLKTCLDKFYINYKNQFQKTISILIIGHIHVYTEQYYKQTLLLVGPDWFSAPSYLYFNKEGVSERIFLSDKTQEEYLLN
ncbi:UDP-2,3-diacylglucosamine diphosphatase [Fluviispira sanaruensis]|uniref:UDP-2,3-diacylglucosamine diphosphatase n=1 Tax=Fluviispira sanaruensis TaxID=2493639 RepID=A0A4P2VST2_FLUSA|nr:metallophosphoesterase [Fluviispira sanaruensis]BBH51892.1 UDP-2,3-diacylglucosamine diphosphatase [Fluviispira sanaruensis]